MLDYAMSEAGMEGLDTYITSRKNMVVQYIETLPILDLCLEA